MGLLSLVLLGLVAGVLAELATGRRAGGCMTKIAVGVVGALLGGALATAAGHEGLDELDLRTVLIAFAGATVLLLLMDALTRVRR